MNGSIRPTVTMMPLSRPQAASQPPRVQRRIFFDDAIEQATGGADEQRHQHGDGYHQIAVAQRIGVVVHEQDHQAGDEGCHGANREIEAAGRNDEGAADSDNGDEGAARQHVGEIAGREEAVVDEDADEKQHGQRNKRRDRGDIDLAEGPARLFHGRFAHAPAPAIASVSCVFTPVA